MSTQLSCNSAPDWNPKQSRQMGFRHQLAQIQVGSQGLTTELGFCHCRIRIQAQTPIHRGLQLFRREHRKSRGRAKDAGLRLPAATSAAVALGDG